MPNSALAVPDQNRAAAPVKIGLGQRQRLVDPQTGAPEHHDQRADATAVAIVVGLAHNGHDLIDGRRVGRVALTLVSRGGPGAEARVSSPASDGARQHQTTVGQKT
jgi:hypothetical protein